jgi:hypothetical protein
MDDSRVRYLALLAVPCAAACGPSMRNVVESDMRFEHCYRIDDDPKASLEHKRSCWSKWTVQYAVGSDRAREHYARQRLSVLDGALASGPEAPSAAGAPAPSFAAPSAAATQPAPDAPPRSVAPTSPYAPPPAVIAPKPGGALAAASPVCVEICNKSWRSCAAPCSIGVSSCLATCDESFRGCVKACL